MNAEWHRVHGHEAFNMPEGVTIPEEFEDITYRNDEMPSWAMYHEDWQEMYASNDYDVEDFVKARININYKEYMSDWPGYTFEWYSHPTLEDRESVSMREPIGYFQSDDWNEIESRIAVYLQELAS